MTHPVHSASALLALALAATPLGVRAQEADPASVAAAPVTVALAQLPAPALATAAPAAATAPGVPSAVAAQITARAAERGVPASEMLAPVQEAAQRGVPPELVAAKVLEGLSKRVPPPRVTAVARELTDRLARAGQVLDGATAAGLSPASDRAAALSDLGAALGAGVQPQHLDALVQAARGGAGRADAVVSAAHAAGELARRGVPADDALGLGLAIARHGALPPAEIPALFDAWRAEGGKDPHAFVKEATHRVDAGRKLDGMVDVFGNSPDHLAHDGDRAAGADHGRGDDATGTGPGNNGRGADKGFVPGARGNAGGNGKGKGKGH